MQRISTACRRALALEGVAAPTVAQALLAEYYERVRCRESNDSWVEQLPGIIMATFFCKLLPPRPTFALDMTDDERVLMQAHGEYWKQAVERGHVVAFGLVGDPSGPFGIGIVELEDEPAARRFTSGDPLIEANRGFRYEILPMPFGVTHR